MRRSILGATGLLGLVACSGSGAGGSGATTGSQETDSITGTQGSGSATATAGTVTATAGTATSGGSGASSAGSTATTGAKFDLPVPDGGGGGGSGGTLPLSCDTLDQMTATSVGCEFWGADLPMLSANELPYAISVGNPTTQLATVTIEDERGPNASLRQITQVMVPAKSSTIIAVNGTGGVLVGQDHGVHSLGVNARAAFRVTSDVPITAMQINPMGGGPSHVAEASLLLPTNALDLSYLALGYPTTFGAWVVVVATEDGTTIQTTAGDVMLDAFDVWRHDPASDATGFFVGADKKVAVFSGESCVLIPGSPWYACDHLEEQVVPLSAWGKSYVAARHPHRVPSLNPAPEEVRWRVVAAVAGTTVDLIPAQPGVGAQIQLADIGDVVEFASTESFVALGDQPFMLVQYMTGCYNVIVQTGSPSDCSQGATGDPYMIQVPPVEQWLTELPFLTDTSYPRDFVMIMREVGTVVNLECLGVVPADHFVAIPGTNYEVGSVDLDIAGAGGEGSCADGEQYLTASAPVGVMVGGIDWATSYGYPGGLNFQSLWVPPTDPPG